MSIWCVREVNIFFLSLYCQLFMIRFCSYAMYGVHWMHDKKDDTFDNVHISDCHLPPPSSKTPTGFLKIFGSSNLEQSTTHQWKVNRLR